MGIFNREAAKARNAVAELLDFPKRAVPGFKGSSSVKIMSGDDARCDGLEITFSDARNIGPMVKAITGRLTEAGLSVGGQTLSGGAAAAAELWPPVNPRLQRLVYGHYKKATLFISAHPKNGGYSGIAARANVVLGKASDAEETHVERLRERDAQAAKARGSDADYFRSF